ncbi:hypothetical protein ACROYT_G003735 [Oculina patagonica]
MNKLLIAILLMFVVASLFVDDSDAWARRRRLKNGIVKLASGKIQEQDIPRKAKRNINTAHFDEEIEAEKYDDHLKNAI